MGSVRVRRLAKEHSTMTPETVGTLTPLHPESGMLSIRPLDLPNEYNMEFSEFPEEGLYMSVQCKRDVGFQR